MHVKLLLFRVTPPDGDEMYIICPLGAEELSTVTLSNKTCVKLVLVKIPPVEFKAAVLVNVQYETVKVIVLSSM